MKMNTKKFVLAGAGIVFALGALGACSNGNKTKLDSAGKAQTVEKKSSAATSSTPSESSAIATNNVATFTNAFINAGFSSDNITYQEGVKVNAELDNIDYYVSVWVQEITPTGANDLNKSEKFSLNAVQIDILKATPDNKLSYQAFWQAVYKMFSKNYPNEVGTLGDINLETVNHDLSYGWTKEDILQVFSYLIVKDGKVELKQ